MTILPSNYLPPPPYYNDSTASQSNQPQQQLQRPLNLLSLSDEILLLILSNLTLPVLSFQFRLVNKKCLLLAKSLLRLNMYSSWLSKIRNNYSSDPLNSLNHREAQILDLYSTSVSQKLLLSGESTLHLLGSSSSASDSAERDLFDLLQPKARLEDLIIVIGKSVGLIRTKEIDVEYSTLNESDLTPPYSTSLKQGIIAEEDILVELSTRTAKLLLPFESTSNTGRAVNKVIVEVKRVVGESLELIADNIVASLLGIKLSRTQTGCYSRI